MIKLHLVRHLGTPAHAPYISCWDTCVPLKVLWSSKLIYDLVRRLLLLLYWSILLVLLEPTLRIDRTGSLPYLFLRCPNRLFSRVLLFGCPIPEEDLSLYDQHQVNRRTKQSNDKETNDVHQRDPLVVEEVRLQGFLSYDVSDQLSAVLVEFLYECRHLHVIPNGGD